MRRAVLHNLRTLRLRPVFQTKETMIRLVHAAMRADVPVLLWGAPGVGKTAIIRALARKEGAHVETLIGSTLDPTDAGGIMVPSEDNVRLLAPPWAQRMSAALKSGSQAWLFLDELNTAPRSVQASLLRVVQERVVANVDLSGCRVIAAANPPALAADGMDLSAATANRWSHLDWEPDPVAWCDGMLNGWGKPQPKALAEARATLASYISRNSNELLRVPEDVSEQGRGWPSPRSLDNLSKVIAKMPGGFKNVHAQKQYVALAGAAAADTFFGWIDAMDLPDPEEVLANPLTHELPNTRDAVETTLYACISNVFGDEKRMAEKWDALWTVIRRAHADVALASAGAAIRARDEHNPGLPMPELVIELKSKLDMAVQA